MQNLKYLLIVLALIFQFDVASAAVKKHAAKAKTSVGRSANYYKAAKYFHKEPKKKSVKVAKHVKSTKGKSKRHTASVSHSKHKRR